MPGATADNVQVNETPHPKPVEASHFASGVERSGTPLSSHPGRTVVPSTYGPHHYLCPSTPVSPADDIRIGEKRALVHTNAEGNSPKRVRSENISYGFAQEDPVSQDPAIEITEQRRKFLRNKSRSSLQSAREALFQRFRSAYPEYQGNIKHFQGVCTLIDKQERAEKMDHSFLWDDFIIQHELMYIPYVESCIDEVKSGGESLPYLSFWRQNVKNPRPLNRIIGPDNIQAVISE
jgi:hypothetical protein